MPDHLGGLEISAMPKTKTRVSTCKSNDRSRRVGHGISVSSSSVELGLVETQIIAWRLLYDHLFDKCRVNECVLGCRPDTMPTFPEVSVVAPGEAGSSQLLSPITALGFLQHPLVTCCHLPAQNLHL